MFTGNNKITPTADINKISIPISSSYWKGRGLDWAESSWKRWIHVVFWFWLTLIFNLGSKHQLTEDDLFEISSNDECSQLLNKLETVWKQNENKYESTDVWKIIIKTFGKEYFLLGLIFFPLIGTRIAQPLFLKRIVLNINDSNAASYEGYLYAIGIGLSVFLMTIIHHQLLFRTIRVGIQARISLSSLIYKRLLSLPTRILMKTTTTGQVINLISNDRSKFEESSLLLHLLWAGPLEACIIFGLIWNEIGIPTLFGYSVLLIMIPLQLFFSKQVGTYRKNTVQWSDKRVKVINEILSGCQIVKMYRWEEALEDIVYNARKNELKSIRKASRIRAINLGIHFSSLALISLATFGGSWLMSQTLSPANIFTILALFNILRADLTVNLPILIEKLSESMVAAKRINQFMNLSKEIHTKTSAECSSW